MAAVIQGHAEPALLDTYEEERLPIAARTLNISSERHRVITKAVENGSGSFVNIATKDTTQLNLNYRYSSSSVDLSHKDGTLKAATAHLIRNLQMAHGFLICIVVRILRY